MSNEHNQIYNILQAAIENEPNMEDRDTCVYDVYGGNINDAYDGGFDDGYASGKADLAKQIIKLISQWGQTNSSNLSSSR